MGFFESLGHKLSSLLPFTGTKEPTATEQFTETQAKIEAILRQKHDEAQARVDALKEDELRPGSTQKKIQQIYLDEAQKAEKEIAALRQPFYEKYATWIHLRSGAKEPTLEEKRGFLERLGLLHLKEKEVQPRHLYEETAKKVSQTYRDLIDKIPNMEDVKDTAGENWENTKAKIARAYNNAFHKGHGEAHTKFGQLREIFSHGLHGAAHGAKKVVSATAEAVWWVLTKTVWMIAGALVGMWVLNLLAKRRFHAQLRANVGGPIVAVGEYIVYGGEEMQKKFYEYWSTNAYAYFGRQPGMRKYWVHRGVSGGENMWLCYSEWASIDDLRRASSTTEFLNIEKRSPAQANSIAKMVVYQVTAAHNFDSAPGTVGKETGISGSSKGDTIGFQPARQRNTATTTTTTST
jgi:hypothetical protein